MPSGKKKQTGGQMVWLAGGTPAMEFRLFRKGWNSTSKGKFLFDDQAAALVMADYKQANNGVMIDLEHLSLDDEARGYDPDARGWCKLQIRNGELWATEVKWTPDGAKRLSERRQRFVSPTFTYDSESMRIESLYNIAICAIPATHEAAELIAASKRTGKKYGTLSLEVKMEELKKIAQAMGLEDDAKLEDILGAIKALQEKAGGEVAAADDDEEVEAADDEEVEASDDEVAAADDEKEQKELSKLPPKLQAKVMAALGANGALRSRLEGLEKNQTKAEVEALIAANTSKIPLRLEAWARKQKPDTLREYLKHAIDSPRGKSEAKREESASAVTLSDADRQVSKLTGISPEKILARKKLNAEKAKQA